MGGHTVAALWLYPESGRPGKPLFEVVVEAEGIVGDRRKKAPISLVGRDAPTNRANVVVDRPNSVVESWAGAVLRVGEVTLAVEATGSACPGLYGSVGAGGVVRVGDEIVVELP